MPEARKKIDRAWQGKAERLIAEACFAEWEKANRRPDGKLRRRHVPYRVPAFAEELVRCLGEGDEEAAKVMFWALAVHPEGVKG